jgi:hypothetical protein
MPLRSSVSWHGSGSLRYRRLKGGFALQLSNETTLFMQKAIYYVSKPIAARGMLELTDRCLHFQVFPFDASFGIKNVSIDVVAITDVTIEKGDLHPKISVIAGRKYEFVLSKGQQLYDRLKELQRNPLQQGPDREIPEKLDCSCGRKVENIFHFCPWCGTKL